MAPKFGTSGLRGLVVDLTPGLVADHARAFLRACNHGTGLFVGRDLRESSPALAGVVKTAALEAGVDVTDCGAVPTPALAMAAMRAGAGAVMVTGSHIPADRNGLKFYTPGGEITKADEAAILAALGAVPAGARPAVQSVDGSVAAAYAARYTTVFAGALQGLRIGAYEHSSVARDILADVLAACGAEVVRLGRSGHFIPVDTEAVDPAVRLQVAAWAAEHGLDAVVSTDGDADRPMVADNDGRIVAGDVLGVLTAGWLGARAVVTPVSSNTSVDLTGRYAVQRTKIGSPFVIAGMEAVLAADPDAKVVGYEANGGFLLGFDACNGALPALMTRDAFLPILAPLAAARAAGLTLAGLAAALPPRFTATDRIEGIAPEAAKAFLAGLDGGAGALLSAAGLAGEVSRDLTDGLRMTLADGTVLHLRPSGNAPEFRVYAEAGSADRAGAMLAAALAAVTGALGG